MSGCGYNTMQKNEEAVKAAWGNVEAAYQRRNDLIPNLVETVKAYAKYEGETLKAARKQEPRSALSRYRRTWSATLRQWHNSSRHRAG